MCWMQAQEKIMPCWERLDDDPVLPFSRLVDTDIVCPFPISSVYVEDEKIVHLVASPPSKSKPS